MNPNQIAEYVLSFIPKGYATKIGGLLMLAGGVGLGADYLAAYFGMDILPGEPTWVSVTGMIGAGISILGGRRAIEGLEKK